MVRHPMVSGLFLSLLPALALPVSASLFTERIATAVSGAPWNLTGGDVDGDGDFDLVVCHFGTQGLPTILLNDGTGRFRQAPESPMLNTSPISAAIGSFNPLQDWFPDLVVVSRGDAFSGETGSLLLGDGTGRFRFQESFGIGHNGGIGQAVSAADFDGDGDDDVMFANGQVFLGSGSSLVHETDLAVQRSGFSVLTGDFDGDGHPDAAFVYNVSVQEPSIGFLQMFLSVGDSGTFVEAPGSPMQIALGSFPETMAAADFDEDGDLDLAVTEYGFYGAHILLNEGDGRMVRLGYAFVPYLHPRGIATADFDGDGHADLAVGYLNGAENGGRISLLLGNGAGGFTLIEESPRIIGSGPSSILAADLNWDGAPDLAAGDFSSVAVFLHTPPSSLEVPIDVLPDSDDNVIRLGSQGSLPVAILSTDAFDATTVIAASVRLAGAPARLDANGDPACQSEDVDHDNRADLLCLVGKAAVGLQPGDTVAVLLATTLQGTAVRGEDTVRVLPGKPPRPVSTTRWPGAVTPL